MELLSFHEVATDFWCGVAMMKSTGLPVIHGQKTSKSAMAIFKYYRDEEGSLRRKQIKAPCEHAVCLLGLEISGQEFLAISCYDCKNIRLMNLTSGKIRVAFRGKEVDYMAEGEGGKVYVKILGEAKVLELDLVSSTFVEGKSFDIGIKDVDDLHYVPSPHRLIVVSHKSNKLVQAISVDTSKKVWNFDQKVDDEEIEPYGLLFIPEHDVILVADDKRIHILRSANGEHLQTVDQFDLGTIYKPLLCKNTIAILSNIDDLGRMSYFTINAKKLSTPRSGTLIFVQ